jgi:hypothetical protein
VHYQCQQWKWTQHPLIDYLQVLVCVSLKKNWIGISTLSWPLEVKWSKNFTWEIFSSEKISHRFVKCALKFHFRGRVQSIVQIFRLGNSANEAEYFQDSFTFCLLFKGEWGTFSRGDTDLLHKECGICYKILPRGNVKCSCLKFRLVNLIKFPMAVDLWSMFLKLNFQSLCFILSNCSEIQLRICVIICLTLMTQRYYCYA